MMFLTKQNKGFIVIILMMLSTIFILPIQAARQPQLVTNPIPYDPPDASRITIGPVDSLGEASVTGMAGAVLPSAHVLLVNLNSSHQAHTISQPNGSFTTKIYAPPGSAILIKHGPTNGPSSWRWEGVDNGAGEHLNPFPGTIINLPHTHTGGPSKLPFAAAGGIKYSLGTPTYVNSAWAMTGTIGSSNTYAPGASFQVDGTIRLYGQGITAATNPSVVSVNGQVGLMMLYNKDGQAISAENFSHSTRLTPSGFPILHRERSIEYLDIFFNVNNFTYLGGHTLKGSFTVAGQIPNDLPPGIYRPIINLDFDGVPTSNQWPAASVTYFTFFSDEAALPPIVVNDGSLGNVTSRQLIWRLLMDDFVQGTRGAGGREDKGDFEIASFIVTQGAPYVTPPFDERTGQLITYRLEPFLPMISFTDRLMPTPPLIPFKLPGGQLNVVIQEPDGNLRNLGSDTFSQSFNRTKTTRGGEDLNSGTVQLEDVYSLMTNGNRFRVTFDQYGHHLITMTGTINDIWGNSYSGGGIYDIWIAHPLDIDPGVLPGTPLAVGDAFNPALQFYPRVPAEVNLSLILYPNSNPAQAVTYTLTGQANDYGYFSSTSTPMVMTQPGEYRVDLTAMYTDPVGKMYMGAMTWGGIVMTPNNQANLIAHGRRGLDNLEYIPNQWFVNCDDLSPPPDSIAHMLNPYFNGDMIWSRLEADTACDGFALILGASVQDKIGAIEAAIQARANFVNPLLASPGTLNQRISKDELPLFSSTNSGRPPQIVPNDVDQIAYSYRSTQRPGVRVREGVAEDGHGGGYWRLDTLYDDQLGVGLEGDLPNDFKFQYIGAVYRDLETGRKEYVGQGSGWVHISDDDPTGSRVMPPFSGPGNGGWTTKGGPIMTLKGQKIHMFILPTGVQPGAVLEVGDSFHFAGHVMPTLNSQVAITVTAPSGTRHFGGGQANRIGYFYDRGDNFIVNEPGLWSVDVRIWHNGQIGTGESTIPPYPSGNVLGSVNGRYWFYAVPSQASDLVIDKPLPGFLAGFPIIITGPIPPGLSNVTLDYTISMPGYILAQGQVTPSGDTYQINFDPIILHQDFPNLDLTGRDTPQTGLADTFAIGLLLRGKSGGSMAYQANTITIQGEQVLIGNIQPYNIYLPMILKKN